MAILNVLHYPDPRLRVKAKPVPRVNEEVRQLAVDLFDTMYAAPGIGLAATQVNVHRRVLVVDVSEERNQPLCLINPVMLSTEGVTEREEGCLSVPGIFEMVRRPEKVRVRALDMNGQEFELEAEDLLGVCIQHEMDHLEGKLFVDYLSPLKRNRIRKKLQKSERLAL
jgi:peptide deformylase